MMKKLTAADGHQLDCWFEPAQGSRKGGVVILQEIFGVTDQLKGVASHYASEGYEVAIPALFDRQKPGSVIPFDQAPVGRDLMLASEIEATTLDMMAAVDALAANGGKVGVIGFCWGGGLAFRAAQDARVSAAVSFYGTRLKQYMDRPLLAPVQGHFGKTDDHTPAELVAEAEAYFPQLQVFMYDAGHAFANDARPSYVAEAAVPAHERTLAFLNANLV